MRKILIATFLFASAASAQIEQGILEDLQRDFGGNNGVPERGEITSQPRAGATLRALDKMTGRAQNLPVMVGGEIAYERLTVELLACRAPAEGDSSDAYAFVRIHDSREDEARFSGWMIASSPALNAMDHPRYDVWVIECIDALGGDALDGDALPNSG